ncbi:MAG: hypothetical protein M5U28_14945 [Sandaracinaceae bacterium]|nr:hypothetical protein [Sandaracinaceae bacterium]
MRDRLAWRAGLLVLALGLLTTRGLDTADAAVHLDLALALALRGETTLSIDPGALWVPSRPLAGGLFYQAPDGLRSASAPGLAALALPFSGASARLEDEPPRFDALFREGDPRAVVRPLQTSPSVIAFALLGPLFAALSVVFLALAARALALSRGAAIAAVSALAVGSPLLSYAGSQWTQLPVAAGLAFVLWRLAAREASAGARVLPIGIACGLVVLVRPDQLPLVVVAGAVLYRIERGWRRSPSRSMARFLVPVAVALGLLSAWGLPESGGGWSPRTLPEGSSACSPARARGSSSSRRSRSSLRSASRTKQRPIAALVAGWLLAALVVYGGWFDWAASLAYGPRFLVPLLPALALAFGAAYDALPARLRSLAWAAVAIGAAAALPGALVLHARIDDADRFFHPSVLAAWRALLEGPAVGALGVDCASTYVVAYPLLALLAAVAGLVLETRRPTG